MIKENEPSIEYPIDWTTDRAPFSFNDYKMIVSDVAIYIEDGMPRENVENAIDTDIFKRSAETARRFYEEGLLNPDILTSTDVTQRFKE